MSCPFNPFSKMLPAMQQGWRWICHELGQGMIFGYISILLGTVGGWFSGQAHPAFAIGCAAVVGLGIGFVLGHVVFSGRKPSRSRKERHNQRKETRLLSPKKLRRREATNLLRQRSEAFVSKVAQAKKIPESTARLEILFGIKGRGPIKVVIAVNLLDAKSRKYPWHGTHIGASLEANASLISVNALSDANVMIMGDRADQVQGLPKGMVSMPAKIVGEKCLGVTFSSSSDGCVDEVVEEMTKGFVAENLPLFECLVDE